MDQSHAESAFGADMVRGIETLKREIGYNPTRFAQMIGEYGAVAAVKRLLDNGPNLTSDGFTRLWEARKLDMSVEFFALLPWYRGLFTSTERKAARRRLELHNFDVDLHLRRAEARPPAWFEAGNRP